MRASNDVNLPKTWKQAINIPLWEKVLEDEEGELESKGAWELVPKTADMNVLPGIWNFMIKKGRNGRVVKHKARWCVDGLLKFVQSMLSCIVSVFI